MESAKRFISLFFDRFFSCRTVTWAASVAFFSALSLAPLLMLLLAVLPLLDIQGKETLIREATLLLGPDGGAAIKMILRNAESHINFRSSSGLIGIITLLISASLVIGQMRAAFTQILDTHETADSELPWMQAIFNFLRDKFFKILLTVGVIFVMSLSAVVSTYLRLQNPDNWLHSAGNFIISFFFYLTAFLLVFHYLPKPHLPWRDAIAAAFMTSGFFILGNHVVSMYLESSFLRSAYGAAGSMVILLVWIYYSCLIVFVGTHVSYILGKIHKSGSFTQRPDA